MAVFHFFGISFLYLLSFCLTCTCQSDVCDRKKEDVKYFCFVLFFFFYWGDFVQSTINLHISKK